MSHILYQFGLKSLDYIWQSIGFSSILLFCITYIYVYFKRKFSYWEQRGIKNPLPIPWLGTAHYSLLTPKPELELELHQKHGRIYGIYDGFLGTNPTLVCGHPEAIKQVTIKHFDQFTNRRKPATWKSIRYRALTYMRDDEWRQMRRVLAPTFTGSKLRKMYELMKKCTNNLQLSIQEHGAETEIDLKRLFSVFTVDIISTCCFSMDLKDLLHPESEILISARKFFNVSRSKMALYMALPKQLLAWVGFDINDNSSIEFFGKFAQGVINTRRKLIESATISKHQEDFLQVLIDAAANAKRDLDDDKKGTDENQQIEREQQDVEVESGGNRHTNENQDKHQQMNHTKYEAKSKNAQMNNDSDTNQDKSWASHNVDTTSANQRRFSERQMGDLEILAQTMLFFAVGHETTATLLSSCGLFLSLYPELQDRLYNEVHEAFEAENGQISYENLTELKYLNAFICEALRFFTPTLSFDREASADVEIEVEGKQILIPKGMSIVIPFHAVHHDPENYEDPERFDPDRFMPENKHKIKPSTFIPFGSGPRYCLASRFAMIEAKLALASLVNKFKFVRSQGTIWPPRYRYHYMLLQMEWSKIRFVDRKLDDANMTGLNGPAQMAA